MCGMCAVHCTTSTVSSSILHGHFIYGEQQVPLLLQHRHTHYSYASFTIIIIIIPQYNIVTLLLTKKSIKLLKYFFLGCSAISVMVWYVPCLCELDADISIGRK